MAAEAEGTAVVANCGPLAARESAGTHNVEMSLGISHREYLTITTAEMTTAIRTHTTRGAH